MPPEVQDKFLLLAQGAAMALDTLRESLAASAPREEAGEAGADRESA